MSLSQNHVLARYVCALHSAAKAKSKKLLGFRGVEASCLVGVFFPGQKDLMVQRQNT